MRPTLLPPDFDRLMSDAVATFWSSRGGASKGAGQGGSRDSVVGGKNMDGFARLVREVAQHCGLPAESVYTSNANVVLPGYFRATKNWDVLVIHERRLLAVFEFKSQVGSFGNNFNNRSEEVVGSAADLWVAHYHRAFDDTPHRPRHGVGEVDPDPALLNPTIQSDPRPPFLAWLMLLEDCEKSNASVKAKELHYPVFEEFHGASYARRYQILCERLVQRQLYAAAAVELTKQGSCEHRSLSEATSLRSLFREFAARMLAATDR